MFRRVFRRLPSARWLFLTALLGTTFGTTTSCTDATQSAIVSGAHTFASTLLDTFFNNITASQTVTPVTVKALNGQN